jgi:anti-sigma regulatory factor (Ser/Thr protein kinase)
MWMHPMHEKVPERIWLTIPGALRYRAVAVRVVAEAARLVSGSARHDEHDLDEHDVRDPFDTAVVSAFMEIFNNVAIHAYHRDEAGRIEITITTRERELIIELADTGTPFDPRKVPELPNATELDIAALPEGGMGLHIAKSMLDDVSYQPGPPNKWRLAKRLPPTTQIARS